MVKDNVKARMRSRLASIDYDFSRFTFDGFVSWLEEQRGRRIVFVPWEMPPKLFGAWLAGDYCDYVFFEKDTQPIHQDHIRLHELAHMLCGHSTVEVDPQDVQALFAQEEVSRPI